MTVDARGFSCPMPVVMVQKAVKSGSPAAMEVLVDNQCSVENVTRFAENSGYKGVRPAGRPGLPPDVVQMSRYIATFHTHLSALLTCQSLTASGAEARMMPVPRKLSASCGTCVAYQAASTPAG